MAPTFGPDSGIPGAVPTGDASIFLRVWSAATTQNPPDPTSVDSLLRAFEDHAANEAEALEGYRRLAETTSDPVVALVMHMVLKDEERHHGLMERMATTLRDGLEWRNSADALPLSRPPADASSPEVMDIVRSWIDEERQGARELEKAAADLRELHGGLFSLLLEWMAVDSQKHERAMRFLARRLESQSAAKP